MSAKWIFMWVDEKDRFGASVVNTVWLIAQIAFAAGVVFGALFVWLLLPYLLSLVGS